MKILILGGNSMIGHQLLAYFAPKYEAKVTLHQSAENYTQYGSRFNKENSYYNIDATDDAALEQVITDYKPNVVINTFGVIKHRDAANEAIPSIVMNALLPHKLANLCQKVNARFITFATDCVFSGDKGDYKIDDQPDARDLYGRTKFLGEIKHLQHCVTIRCSFVGLELTNKTNLIEWFLAQRGEIKGFTRAIYTGVTTIEMARIIESIITQHKELFGLYQVASQKIDKYTLVAMLAKKLNRTDITIVPDNKFHCDRSLDGSSFVAATGYQVPSWDAMLTELAAQIQARNTLE